MQFRAVLPRGLACSIDLLVLLLWAGIFRATSQAFAELRKLVRSQQKAGTGFAVAAFQGSFPEMVSLSKGV